VLAVAEWQAEFYISKIVFWIGSKIIIFDMISKKRVILDNRNNFGYPKHFGYPNFFFDKKIT